MKNSDERNDNFLTKDYDGGDYCDALKHNVPTSPTNLKRQIKDPQSHANEVEPEDFEENESLAELIKIGSFDLNERTETDLQMISSESQKTQKTFILLPTSMETFDGKQYLIAIPPSSSSNDILEHPTFITLQQVSLNTQHSDQVSNEDKVIFVTNKNDKISSENTANSIDKIINDVQESSNTHANCIQQNESSYQTKSQVESTILPLPPLVCTTKRQNSKVILDDETPSKKRFSNEPRTCSTCGRSFKYPSDLRKHEQIHNEIRRFSCDECGRSFRRLHQLNVHKRIHTGEKPYVCSSCGMSFRHDSTLTMHFRTRHQHLKPFQCGICNKLFGRLSHLRKHQRYVCSSLSPSERGRSSKSKRNSVECNICGLLFHDPSIYESHKQVCNENTSSEFDNILNPGSARFILTPLFQGSSNIRISDAAGLDSKDFITGYQCDACKKVFPEYEDLTNHLVNSTDEEYCAALRLHISSESNADPVSNETENGVRDLNSIFHIVQMEEGELENEKEAAAASVSHYSDAVEYDSNQDSLYSSGPLHKFVDREIFHYDPTVRFYQQATNSEDKNNLYEDVPYIVTSTQTLNNNTNSNG